MLPRIDEMQREVNQHFREANEQLRRDAALGRITRAYDWNAETWEAAITDAYTHGLPGLADKCTDIAAEIRRQEAEHEVS